MYTSLYAYKRSQQSWPNDLMAEAAGRVNEHGLVSGLAVFCFKPAGTVLMATPSFHERKGKEEKLTRCIAHLRRRIGKISKIEEFPFLASEFDIASCSEIQNLLGLPEVRNLLPSFPSEENRKPGTSSNLGSHHSALSVKSNLK